MLRILCSCTLRSEPRPCSRCPRFSQEPCATWFERVPRHLPPPALSSSPVFVFVFLLMAMVAAGHHGRSNFFGAQLKNEISGPAGFGFSRRLLLRPPPFLIIQVVCSFGLIIRVVRSFGKPNRGYPSSMAQWFAHLGRLVEATLHGLQRASIAISRVLNLA